MACNTAESTVSERPLSPILNATKIHRKIIFGIRKKRSKSSNTSDSPRISQIRGEILKCTDTTQRLRKLKEYEDEKHKLHDYFYASNSVQSEFEFKKPIPVKQFRRNSIECLKSSPFSQENQVASFYDSAPFEGEKPIKFNNNSLEQEILELEQVLRQGDIEIQKNAITDSRKRLINTIKNVNYQLDVVSKSEKVFLGFEDVEIKLATKLFNKITAAHQKKFHTLNACKSNDIDCSCLGKVGENMDGEVGESEVCKEPEDYSGLSGCGGNSSNIKVEELEASKEHLSEKGPTLNVCNDLISESSTSCASFSNQSIKSFSTANGKDIEISGEALLKANKLFAEDFSCTTKPDVTSNTKNYSNPNPRIIDLEAAQISMTHKQGPMNSFSTAGGKSIKISSEALVKANKLFSDDLCDVPKLDGFATAGGKSIEVSEEKISIAKKLFSADVNDFPAASLSTKSGPAIDCAIGFSTAAGKNIEISKEAIARARTHYAKEFDDTAQCKLLVKKNNGEAEGFSTAGGNAIKISKELLSKVSERFADEFGDNISSTAISDGMHGFTTAAGKDSANLAIMSNAEDVINRNETQTLAAGFTSGSGKSLEITECATTKAQRLFENDKCDENKENFKKAEKCELEMDQNVSANQKSIELEKTSLTLNDSKDTPRRGRKRLGISGCKQIPISYEKLQKAELLFNDSEITEPTTPHKYIQTNLYNSTPVKLQSISKSWSEFDSMSPVAKKPRFCSNDFLPVKQTLPRLVPFILQQQTGDTTKRMEDFNIQQENLENQLRLLQERRNALLEQTHLIESADDTHKRRRVGILLQKKQSNQMRTLQNFVSGSKPSGNSQTPLLLTKITPQNAHHIHFNDNSFKDTAVVRTEDGACIIPNSSHLIGLSEIRSAFRAMPGVDPKLIPNKWIDNHFKWVVWKLVSYERSFANLSGSLTLENVIQQLKYRYDREIDMAQRSALRRILEKDDVPQKRMVLCVSNIYKLGDTYELELCDGWYGVRTVIDQALSCQIRCGKIVIGTKLITQYAELLDCDGCHPLEVAEHVRLKINFNCTRRATWFAKLGYQRIPKPFPISLGTVKPEGGLIGCISVYIARVYPLRFMEKHQEGKVIWRNQKAEEKFVQQWENEQMKEIEVIRNRISRDYELLTNDDDSQGLQSTQAINTRAEQQNQLSIRLSTELNKLKTSNREVIPVLKMRVVDCTSSNPNGFIFNIWKAGEQHISDLKEGATVSIYNVMPRRNGELTATSRTHFTQYQTSSPNNKMQRQLIPISMLQQPFLKPIFNEFDSVGTVVHITKSTNHQELWLCDFLGRLLFIRVRECSNTCSLFDSISRGQHVTVSNLIFCKPYETFAQAVANQHCIVTRYPSHSLLQDSLVKYCQQLPQDLNSLLIECDTKIESIKLLLESSNVCHLLNDTLEDSMEIPSRLTSLDVAMSLIDTDQFN